VRLSRVDRDLPCRELVELVTDYLEGALELAERARFEAHLAECQACRDYVEQMRTTVRLTGRVAGLQERPEITTLLVAFRGYRRGA
jgi:predicted anti-sigma-YlaC factor YlaD